MNEIFSYKRFGKLLKTDIARYLPKSYGTVLILLGLLPAIWLLMTLLKSDSSLNEGLRFVLIFISTVICTFFSVYKMYGHVNHKKKGVDFIMLPASSLEKFLSMTLISTVLLPIAFFTAAIILDYILASIPNGVYDGYIKGRYFNTYSLKIFGIFILSMSFTLYGNMLFRKSKAAKTFFSGLLLSVCISTIMTLGVYNITKRMVYINEEKEIRSLATGKIISQDELDDNAIILEESNDAGSKKVKITRDGQTYILSSGSVNNDMISYLSEHEKVIYILFQIFILGVIPAVMYFLTYNRINKQQL